MTWINEFISAFWSYVAESAPYLLLGFTVAGFIHAWIPMSKVKKWLGGEGFKSVFRAALVGVPLPLCSCSVIPTAVTLRKSGASNAATSSFLIATPESGIDSIAMTYSMMDFPMTIIRPIAAFVSAFVAGVLQHFFNPTVDLEKASVETKEVKSCCSKTNGAVKPKRNIIKEALTFSFKDLAEDLAFWMLIGLVSGALINVFVPADFFANISPEYSMLAILVVGIPFYICASASTPIAASLMMKGLNPGAALLFLLVGPATNISNLLVLQKYIGKKGVILNLIAIVVVGLGFAYSTDFIYTSIFKTAPIVKMAHHNHETTSWFNHFCGIFLITILLRGLWVEEIAPKFKANKHAEHCH